MSEILNIATSTINGHLIKKAGFKKTSTGFMSWMPLEGLLLIQENFNFLFRFVFGGNRLAKLSGTALLAHRGGIHRVEFRLGVPLDRGTP